jgi:hypothetical protein
MGKAPRPWIVVPHDPIQKLDDDLWAVEGQIPGVPNGRRRMVMARRGDGSIVFFNAVPLADEALAELAAWGRPACLVLATSSHMIDAHAFRERLGVTLYCAAAAMPRARAVVTVDGDVEDLPVDARVRLVSLHGTKRGEVALIATGARGDTSVAFGDAFMNMPKGSGWLMALLRFSGAPRCPPFFRMAFVGDKPALARDMDEIAALPGLARLIPSHGAIIDVDAATVLRDVIARDLRRAA